MHQAWVIQFNANLVLSLPVYTFIFTCSFVLYVMVFCNQFVFEHFVSNIRPVLKKYTVLAYFIEINFLVKILMIKSMYKFRTIKGWFTLHLQM